MIGRLQRGIEGNPHYPRLGQFRSWQREALGQEVDARRQRKTAPRLALAGCAQCPTPGGIADQARERRGKRQGVAGRHQKPGRAMLDQLGNCRKIGGNAGERLALRLDEHVRQPVPVAVRRRFGGKHEEIGAAIGGEHLGLSQGATPLDPRRKAKRLCPAPQRRGHRAAADMDKAPSESGRQEHQRGEQIVIALFCHRPADRQQLDRTRGIAAVAAGGTRRRRRELLEIEPMITMCHALRMRCQAGEMGMRGFRAGHRPGGGRQFFALLPFGRRPDVLGVRRDRPDEAAEQGRIPGNRCRGVQEMRVQPIDIGRQLGGQHQRLAEAPNPVRGRIAAQIGEPSAARAAIARPAPQPEPSAPDPARLAVEIFRQIEHSGADPAMDRMNCMVGRPAQRDDQDLEPALLQAENFLRDEGFRKARVALQNKGDPPGCGRRHA